MQTEWPLPHASGIYRATLIINWNMMQLDK